MRNIIGIESMYCLDMSKDIYIEGDFTANTFAHLIISIRECNQTDTNKKCAS